MYNARTPRTTPGAGPLVPTPVQGAPARRKRMPAPKKKPTRGTNAAAAAPNNPTAAQRGARRASTMPPARSPVAQTGLPYQPPNYFPPSTPTLSRAPRASAPTQRRKKS